MAMLSMIEVAAYASREDIALRLKRYRTRKSLRQAWCVNE
jgi:hypothetical protein